MREIHLALEHVAVGYHGKALIRDMEIGVGRGEILTLIGPNGAGKSTILRTITRQLTPVDGEIFLADGDRRKNLAHYSAQALARRMAVVLTGRLQAELMTCWDVAAMGRYPYTGRLGILSEAEEEKVEEALAAVHARHLAERPFDAVSDGERQRILLARAICQDPEIIVLDEPTSFLDIRHKLELLSILHTMARERGITVVMSLHEIDLAMKISDRVVCVRDGEIFACGKPSEVLDDAAVRRLYDLDPALGGFDTRTGSLQLHFAASALSAVPAQDQPSGQLPDQPPYLPPDHTGFLPRLMIAAPGSGSGKTLITCGLLRLLQNRGLAPAAFKCGPDYIDPMFHRTVLQVPSRNLDTWFLPGRKELSTGRDCPADESAGGTFPEEGAGISPRWSVQEILARTVRRSGSGIALIEGVMGYYDGTGASGALASSRELALQTRTPVALVVNARGMSRSVVPLLQGFAAFEKGDRRIRGVILNRISAGMFPLMKKWIEEETDLLVLGYVPQDEGLVWESRHLGLVRPEEIAGFRRQIDDLAGVMEQTIDAEALLSLAQSAPPLKPRMSPGDKWHEGTAGTAAPADAASSRKVKEKNSESLKSGKSGSSCCPRRPRIAVASDEAFCFYYEDNLELLQECGADLVFFSPVHDSALPEADGLLLGGGYPELYAKALSANGAMRAQILARAAAGLPVLAECGGFLYLQEYLELRDPEAGEKEDSPVSVRRYPMCGVLPGVSRMTDHLVRFGYVELEKRDEDRNGNRAENRNGNRDGNWNGNRDENRNKSQDENRNKSRDGIFVTSQTAGVLDGDGAETTGYLQRGHRIRGHEFHYFDSTDNGEAYTAYKPGRSRFWNCMVVRGNITAGFPHLYYRSDPAFAARFVDRCRQHRDAGKSRS